MAQTKIKAGLFEGIIGNGTDGYFLMSNGDGTMTWASTITNPTISSIAYPGSVTAADPAGGETITVTGTGFKTGATVTIGGTAAPAVSYVSATQITFTTPAKAAGDYDIVITNTDTGSATFINGISYNGIPTWTTAAGSLGTFDSDTTISTITLQATEPDAGTITFSITNGALPTGLSLTGANIDGTTSLETADTLYTFTVTATDDESQATPRTFTITVTKQFISTENFTINTYVGDGASTQTIEGGKIGTAASFNGSSSDIDLPSGMQSSTMAVSMFAFFTATPDTDVLIEFENGYGINFLSSDSGYVLAQYANSSGSNIKSNSAITTNQWYHIVANFTSSSAELYIDKVQQTGGTVSNYITADQNTIGSRRADGFIPAKIDQVRIFNKALSSSEVTTLYDESNTSTTKSTTDIFDDGSGVALYEFEEGAKDTGGSFGSLVSSSEMDLDVDGYTSGSVADLSGNGNTGTVTGATHGTAPNGGGYFDFDGSNDDISVAHNTAFNSSTNISFEVWVNRDTTTEDTILSKGTTSSNNYFFIYSPSNGYYYYNYVSGGGVKSGTTGLSTGQWEHVVVTRDGSGASKIYVNGQDKSTAVGSPSTSSTTDTGALNIGGRNGYTATAQGFFDGKIGDVRFYTKQLSASEVAQNFNASKGSYGVGYDGTPTNVSFVGTSFQPDLVWVKSRVGNYWHVLQDSVRGAGAGKSIYPNGPQAEGTYQGDGYISAINANGFSVSGGASSSLQTNGNGIKYVAWCWKSGGTAASNTDGSITSSVSANSDAGFSIVKYNGTGNVATIGHGLSSAPELIIIKKPDVSSSWSVYPPLGSNYIMFLNDADAAYTGSSTWWNNTDPTSNVFTIGTYNVHNTSGADHIAYCFHSVDGYQKLGTYTATGSAGSPTVTTGFQPRFVMVKNVDKNQEWIIVDSARNNGANSLQPNSTAAENTTGSNAITLGSTGFTIAVSGSGVNYQAGDTFIYLAIA